VLDPYWRPAILHLPRAEPKIGFSVLRLDFDPTDKKARLTDCLGSTGLAWLKEEEDAQVGFPAGSGKERFLSETEKRGLKREKRASRADQTLPERTVRVYPKRRKDTIAWRVMRYSFIEELTS